MRIATVTQFDRAVYLMQQKQQQLQHSQDGLISGKRIARPSDDPTQAARAERALARESRMEANLRALEASRNVMEQSESALGDGIDVMQRIRELVVQAGNGTYAMTQYRSLGEEIQGLRGQLLGIANRSDGAGSYLFAGLGSTAVPFADNPTTGEVTFGGLEGSMLAATSDVLPLSVDGQSTWMYEPNADGDSVFAVLHKLGQALTDGSMTDVTVPEGLQAIDKVMENLISVRSRLGGTLNQIDGIDGRLAEQKLAAQTDRSEAEDLDMVEAVSQFQARQTSYDAALKAYSMVQRLSLFEYIR
jgi:flagellar hook-associated protein 3 FlgL